MKEGIAIRLKVYGGAVLLLIGLYFYQPIRVDFFPKPAPNPNPSVSPDPAHLFSRNAKVMVVTAHPDDSEYYLGPFLLRLAKAGAKVNLVVCTDGDKSYYPWQNGGEMRKIRRGEQLAAAMVWKANSVSFLGYPDGLQPRPNVVAAIGRQIALRHPDWLVTFAGNYPPRVAHGDHRSAGQAAMLAAEAGGPKWVMMFATHAPNYTADVSHEASQEEGLLALHTSEFSGAKLVRISNGLETEMSEEGDGIGVPFGIEFRCLRLK